MANDPSHVRRKPKALELERGTSDNHRLLSSDIRAAEVPAMAMNAFPGAPAPREEEAECTPGALSSECVVKLAEFYTLLHPATFGDCLIRAHYKHQVTFARS